VTTARLVLVHGTRFSATQWAPYAERFPDLDVVTPDLPGHGSRVGEPFSTAAAVAAIADAVEQGGARLPVVLLGHSLGGYMAMAYAAAHTRRLAGLVLVGSAAVPEGLGAAAYRLLGKALVRSGEARAGALANRLIGRMAGAEVRDAVLAGGTTYDALPAAWDAVMADCRPGMLAGVHCPVLVVGGQLDQLALHARRFAAVAPDGRVHIVKGATHFLPLTHRDELTALVTDFVAEVTGAGGRGAGA
jgi:pimeloyl-ACP methyl ester carboxylesterase